MDANKALRKEVEERKRYGPRTVFVFLCKNVDCETEIRVRSDALQKHSGYCTIHSHQKLPFESIYNRIKASWRKTPVKLSYEEFVNFTKISRCFYCGTNIPWRAYATIAGVFDSAAYFLDRKDNLGPYSKENCVVCCSSCNKFKGALGSEEFITKCAQVACHTKGGSCGA